MASSHNKPQDEALLRRYLLGSLPEAEAERLDELSISDEEFVWRLDAVENDLVDAYVRGELSTEATQQFKTSYLASPQRRAKVQFAQGLLELEQSAASLKTKSKATGSRTSQSSWRLFSVPGLQWGMATAIMGLLVFGGYLVVQNVQLRKQLSDMEAKRASLSQSIKDLQKQLDDDKTVLSGAPKGPQNAQSAGPSLDQLQTVSLLLPPPMRGAGQLPIVSIHPGTDLVVVVLSLDTNDFPSYQVKLRDPSSNKIIWQGPKLEAASGAGRPVVSFSVAASLLKPQTYIAELQGISKRGGAEVVGGYAFRVLLQ